MNTKALLIALITATSVSFVFFFVGLFSNYWSKSTVAHSGLFYVCDDRTSTTVCNQNDIAVSTLLETIAFVLLLQSFVLLVSQLIAGSKLESNVTIAMSAFIYQILGVIFLIAGWGVYKANIETVNEANENRPNADLYLYSFGWSFYFVMVSFILLILNCVGLGFYSLQMRKNY